MTLIISYKRVKTKPSYIHFTHVRINYPIKCAPLFWADEKDKFLKKIVPRQIVLPAIATVTCWKIIHIYYYINVTSLLVSCTTPNYTLQRPSTATPKLPALTQPAAARSGTNHPHFGNHSKLLRPFPLTRNTSPRPTERLLCPHFISLDIFATFKV